MTSWYSQHHCTLTSFFISALRRHWNLSQSETSILLSLKLILVWCMRWVLFSNSLCFCHSSVAWNLSLTNRARWFSVSFSLPDPLIFSTAKPKPDDAGSQACGEDRKEAENPPWRVSSELERRKRKIQNSWTRTDRTFSPLSAENLTEPGEDEMNREFWKRVWLDVIRNCLLESISRCFIYTV